ncbi:MAG TPA: alpha/beta hydrolase-fold protein, partial [Terriglobales bacterium]|nr:alpha/beta hydrolase-fold protein [Terriglobales bacterium]
FTMSRPTTRKPKTKPATTTAMPVSSGSLWLHELDSRIFGNTRLVRVWLPPDYEGWGATRYPVLYLNDGQNLFDPATAFAGVHWQVGETAARLIAEEKIRPLIIVGIDNTKNRACEYIPYKSRDPRVLNAKGKCYPDFLQREVMPLIEERYSVLKGPENRGLGGSSLGGLMALYTQLAAPGVFGRLLIESPSLFVANRKILEESRRFRSWSARTYLGMGTREVGHAEKDERIVGDVRELETILREAGLDEQRLKVRIEEGGSHSETAWAARFPEALEFLYSS